MSRVWPTQACLPPSLAYLPGPPPWAACLPVCLGLLPGLPASLPAWASSLGCLPPYLPGPPPCLPACLLPVASCSSKVGLIGSLVTRHRLVLSFPPVRLAYMGKSTSQPTPSLHPAYTQPTPSPYPASWSSNWGGIPPEAPEKENARLKHDPAGAHSIALVLAQNLNLHESPGTHS